MIFDPIHAGKVVDSFLSDETIQQIFRERKLLYFEEWLRANDPAERERIHARARAFSDLNIALSAVVHAKLQAEAQPALERRSE